jgi:hypothetical protein
MAGRMAQAVVSCPEFKSQHLQKNFFEARITQHINNAIHDDQVEVGSTFANQQM